AQAGIFKTTDDGAHWTAMNRGLTDPIVNALWVDPSNQNLVLAGTESDGIFRSTDGGANWSRIGAYGPVSDFLSAGGTLPAAVATVGVSPQAVAFAPSTHTILVAGADGLWSSTDGRNWRVLPFGRWDSRRIYWNDAQKILYLGTDQGLHRSTDSGASFTSLTG